jgi:hypothetical protein
MDSSVFKARQGEREAMVARCGAGKPLIVVVPRSVKGMQNQGGLASWHIVEQVVGKVEARSLVRCTEASCSALLWTSSEQVFLTVASTGARSSWVSTCPTTRRRLGALLSSSTVQSSRATASVS